MFDEKADLFIWPWSGQRRGSIGGEIWTVLRSNDNEISLENKRPKMNGGNGMSEFT